MGDLGDLAETVTNTSKLSPILFVSNIRHQHRRSIVVGMKKRLCKFKIIFFFFSSKIDRMVLIYFFGKKSQVHFLLAPSFKEIISLVGNLGLFMFDILICHYPKSLLQYKFFVSFLLCVIWLKLRVQHNICNICYAAYFMPRNFYCCQVQDWSV